MPSRRSSGRDLMATNILQLPKVSIPCSIESNEDWRDALAYTNISNNPVPLDGIAFMLSVRQSNADAWVMLSASLADYLLILPASANVAIQAAGTAYAINDTITLPGDLVLVVSGIGSSGAITAVSIKTPGSFSVIPTNPVGQLATSGSGTGAAFTLTFVNNALTILVPASVVGSALPDGSYTYEVLAVADGYTADVIEGALTVGAGAST